MAEHPIRSRATLVLALALASAGARAEVLPGLEMDVMEPGETAAQATSRIVLPRPRSGMERSADYPGLDTEQRIGVSAHGDRLDAMAGEGLTNRDPSAGAVVDPVEPPTVPVDPGAGTGTQGDATGGPGG